MQHQFAIDRVPARGRVLHRSASAAGRTRTLLQAFLLLACGGLFGAGPIRAQQFVTDDAELVDLGACQLEGWHGESASWVLPACQPIEMLEITAGVGFVPEDGAHAVEYVLQGKVLIRSAEPGRLGIGLVGGLGFGPISQVVGDGVAGAYAYVPVTVPAADEGLILHVNVGWQFERDDLGEGSAGGSASRHAFTWAARADLALPHAADRLTLIGELYGVDRVGPEYQLGIRTVLVEDRLLFDLSWGGHTASAERGAGWALGVAWTPPPFF
jgi:hypothetical protein